MEEASARGGGMEGAYAYIIRRTEPHCQKWKGKTRYIYNNKLNKDQSYSSCPI